MISNCATSTPALKPASMGASRNPSRIDALQRVRKTEPVNQPEDRARGAAANAQRLETGSEVPRSRLTPAMATSIGCVGRRTVSVAARPSVTECASVNAVTIFNRSRTTSPTVGDRDPARGRGAQDARQQQQQQERNVVVADQHVPNALTQKTPARGEHGRDGRLRPRRDRSSTVRRRIDAAVFARRAMRSTPRCRRTGSSILRAVHRPRTLRSGEAIRTFPIRAHASWACRAWMLAVDAAAANLQTPVAKRTSAAPRAFNSSVVRTPSPSASSSSGSCRSAAAMSHVAVTRAGVAGMRCADNLFRSRARARLHSSATPRMQCEQTQRQRARSSLHLRRRRDGAVAADGAARRVGPRDRLGRRELERERSPQTFPICEPRRRAPRSCAPPRYATRPPLAG